jgi:hypothetical protein
METLASSSVRRKHVTAIVIAASIRPTLQAPNSARRGRIN